MRLELTIAVMVAHAGLARAFLPQSSIYDKHSSHTMIMATKAPTIDLSFFDPAEKAKREAKRAELEEAIARAERERQQIESTITSTDSSLKDSQSKLEKLRLENERLVSEQNSVVEASKKAEADLAAKRRALEANRAVLAEKTKELNEYKAMKSPIPYLSADALGAEAAIVGVGIGGAAIFGAAAWRMSAIAREDVHEDRQRSLSASKGARVPKSTESGQNENDNFFVPPVMAAPNGGAAARSRSRETLVNQANTNVASNNSGSNRAILVPPARSGSNLTSTAPSRKAYPAVPTRSAGPSPSKSAQPAFLNKQKAPAYLTSPSSKTGWGRPVSSPSSSRRSAPAAPASAPRPSGSAPKPSRVPVTTASGWGRPVPSPSSGRRSPAQAPAAAPRAPNAASDWGRPAPTPSTASRPQNWGPPASSSAPVDTRAPRRVELTRPIKGPEGRSPAYGARPASGPQPIRPTTGQGASSADPMNVAYPVNGARPGERPLQQGDRVETRRGHGTVLEVREAQNLIVVELDSTGMINYMPMKDATLLSKTRDMGFLYTTQGKIDDQPRNRQAAPQGSSPPPRAWGQAQAAFREGDRVETRNGPGTVLEIRNDQGLLVVELESLKGRIGYYGARDVRPLPKAINPNSMYRS